MKASIPNLKKITLKQVTSIHAAAQPYAKQASNLLFDSNVEYFTEMAMERLLQLHPLHVIKVSAGYQLIAGFRSYQLAIKFCQLEDKVFVVCHHNTDDVFVTELATADLLASRIMHSLGKKPPKQLAAIIKQLGREPAERIVTGIFRQREIKRAINSG